MSHYYKFDENLKTNEKEITINMFNDTYQFITDIGVFSKNRLDYGSKVLLLNTNIKSTDNKILDLGCGFGPIGIILAKQNKDKNFYLIDINKRAVELAYKNSKLNNLTNVYVNQDDILKNNKEKYDLILTNPPIRAGKDVVFKFYEESFKNLNNGGRLLVVIQKKQGAPSSFNKLKELFNYVNVIAKDKGYWIIEAIKHISVD